MSIRSKAIFETSKFVGLFALIFTAFYLLMNVLGPKLGTIFILFSMAGWFIWITYDYYYNKFIAEEKFKN